MRIGKPRARSGFSLIEVVIVVVIIAIIGAIAIPRMSRGAAGAADSALVGTLSVLRGAIDLYATEHNGAFPSADKIEAALTSYTDAAGNTSASKTPVFVYGPYIRKLPPLPVGVKKGSFNIGTADGETIGWIYNETTGSIFANCGTSEHDQRGICYNAY